MSRRATTASTSVPELVEGFPLFMAHMERGFPSLDTTRLDALRAGLEIPLTRSECFLSVYRVDRELAAALFAFEAELERFIYWLSPDGRVRIDAVNGAAFALWNRAPRNNIADPGGHDQASARLASHREEGR